VLRTSPQVTVTGRRTGGGRQRDPYPDEVTQLPAVGDEAATWSISFDSTTIHDCSRLITAGEDLPAVQNGDSRIRPGGPPAVLLNDISLFRQHEMHISTGNTTMRMILGRRLPASEFYAITEDEANQIVERIRIAARMRAATSGPRPSSGARQSASARW